MSPADPTLEHPVVAGLRALSAGLRPLQPTRSGNSRTSRSRPPSPPCSRCRRTRPCCRRLLLGEADQRDLKSRTGAPNLVRWLGDRFRLSRTDAAGRVRQAGDLLRHRPVRDALTAGAVTVEQATTAATALDQVAALPGLTDEDRTSAARFLLEQCAALTPPELARAGRAVVEALTRTPSRDDPDEAAALDRDQQRAEADAQAAERNDLRVTRRRGRLRAVLDLGPLGEATLHAWLRRIDSRPAGRRTTACRDQRLPPERRSDALVELLAAAAAAPHGSAPDAAAPDGDDVGEVCDRRLAHRPPRRARHRQAGRARSSGPLPPLALLTVTTTEAGLRSSLPAAGRLDTGGIISAAALRQLACDALVIPAVLGGPSQILDLGRSTRVWNRAQRRAAALRDRGCTAPGCDRPPAACQLHHARHWIDGGPTDLTNAALLCALPPPDGPPPRLDRHPRRQRLPPARTTAIHRPRPPPPTTPPIRSHPAHPTTPRLSGPTAPTGEHGSDLSAGRTAPPGRSGP